MIDWDFALRTAERMVPPGPGLSAAEVADVIADLRAAASSAEEPVRTFTGLTPSPADETPVLVIDRPRWVEANLVSSRVLLEPVLAKIQNSNRAPSGLAKSVGESINGMEMGALLAFLSSKVLGQFDPFGLEPGRLLLVAPNIVHAERQLGVDPHDFRRWVCLHEETHRVQFTAVPWLAGHMRSLVADFTEATDLDAAALGKLLTSGMGEIIRIIRGASDASLMDVLQNDAQRLVVDKVTGVMSLLEGHADVVMDGVGPEVIPSVAEIRRAFERRRSGSGGLDRVVRRLLGLEAKMRQYRDGAAFVRAVSEKVGHDGFNAVWASAENLPSKSEILEPQTWVNRVHG
jgi:coenzyme F420 biosynthesis associated uncharacterized protein